MGGLIHNKVWNRVQRLTNRKVIDTKIVFKRKVDANGQVERYKRRFVAQRFRQVPGLDYTETFALTPAAATTRMLLALAALDDMELHHIDLEQAFIQAAVEIYVELPEVYQDFRGAVDKLNGSLQRLVQASLNWNSRLMEALMDIRFEESMAVPCLLRKFNSEEQLEAILVVRVDEILSCTKDPAAMKLFKEQLPTKFCTKDSSEARFYTGCHINRNRAKGTPTVGQHGLLR